MTADRSVTRRRQGALRWSLLGAVSALASGCAIIPPPPVVTGPLTAPPPAREMPMAVPNGAIFQPSVYGNYPLFEDRRPRNIGDIVTVVLNERTNATKSVATTTARTGSVGLGFEAVPRVFGSGLTGQDAELTGNNAANGTGSTNANNVFSGTITTTVLGVLPNGNLQVAGEKQIAINRGSEYVRFSGVVDPRSILGNNTVSSTQVADARIEYRSQGVMDEVQTMGWLQRFFLIASPM
ncbi:flagellar basal body L-ring protein FlgH [Achromobacter sp. GG226]|uniref:flagellar basal body L-ring protein FlgH n=1 Tax=Verticiella alkaliphila TaxID=2779529 RepID=UPI001C0D4707|nr:flagellar basal body L-ring protein FlgH [Verticiella sp. GG226]MBU4610500.1 flagellar basal body L-ring protein FlgH [Verticiella sp. GG226]